jgi:hypothetical protein
MRKTTFSTRIGMSILLAVLLSFAGLGGASAQATTGSVTITVLPAVGGTSNPGAGTYTYTSPQDAVLTATADAGWQFDHWVYSGPYLGGHSVLGTDEGNVIYSDTIDVTHNYDTQGYTYNYQPVFVPTAAASANADKGVPITYVTVLVAALAAVAVVVGVAAYSAGKRKA